MVWSVRGVVRALHEPGRELLDDPPAGEVDQLVANMDAVAASSDDARLMQYGELLRDARLTHRKASGECAHRRAAPVVEQLDQANARRIAEHLQHRRHHLDRLLGQGLAW